MDFNDFMNLNNFIDFCSSYNRLLCYGAGKYGRVIREFLHEKNIELDAFLVSDRCQESKIMGIPVYGLQEVSLSDDDIGIIIGVGNTYRDEVLRAAESHNARHCFTISKKLFSCIERSTAYSTSWGNNNICVLLYHRVADLPMDVWSLAIRPEVFEAHIRFYKEHYKILRFEDDWSNVREPSLIITFDDGYADNYYNALPILEKYEVPATVFVSTGNLDTDKEFWWDELERIVFFRDISCKEIVFNDKKVPLTTHDECVRACRLIRLKLKSMLPLERAKCLNELKKALRSSNCNRRCNRTLSFEELRKLSESPYITIGGHTVTHSMLSAQPPDMQMEEIAQSKAKIENIINKSITTFSYPFGGGGDFDKSSLEKVKLAGYEKAATTIGGTVSRHSNPLMINRIGVPFWNDIDSLDIWLKQRYCIS